MDGVSRTLSLRPHRILLAEEMDDNDAGVVMAVLLLEPCTGVR